MARIKKTQILSKSPRSASTPSKGKTKKLPTTSPRRSSANNSTNRGRSNLDVSSVRSSTGSPRKRRRRKAANNALVEIRFYQKTSHVLIPKLSFGRVVKEILLQQLGAPDMRIQTLALEALQESAELFLVRYFQEANLCALHARRITLQVKDMNLVKAIKYSD